MTFIGDSRRAAGPGILPLRHRDYDTDRGAGGGGHFMEYRAGCLVIRVRSWRTELGRPVAYKYDEKKDVADLEGIFIWKNEKVRVIPAARFSWPAIVVGRKEVTDFRSKSDPDGMGTGDTEVLPLNHLGKADRRFSIANAKEARARDRQRVKGEKEQLYPAGVVGVVLAASYEARQDPYFFPSGGNPLIAVNHAGDPRVGTLVSDITPKSEIDPLRKARLQTHLWVIKDPQSAFVSFPNKCESLALNINTTGRGDGRGGLCIDKSTSLSDLGSSWGLDVTQLKKAMDGLKSKPKVKTSKIGKDGRSVEVEFETPPKKPPVPTGSRVLGMLSVHNGGPLDMGAPGDKHTIGVDADGRPIHSAHISCLALYRAGNEADGPLAFEPVIYGDPGPLPERSRVHLRWNPEPTHPWINGGRRGAWMWLAEFTFKKTPGIPNGKVPPEVPIPDPPPWKPPITEIKETPPREVETPERNNGGGKQTKYKLSMVIPDRLTTGSFTEDIEFGLRDADTGEFIDPYSRSAQIRRFAQRASGLSGNSLPVEIAPVSSTPQGYSPPSMLVPEPYDGHGPQKVRRKRRSEFPRPFAYARMEHGFSVILARPQRQGVGDLDFRNAENIEEQDSALNERTVPITGRLEAWGAQGRGEGWAYTESPGVLYTGGSSRGGFVLLPPEMTLTNLRDGILPPALSDTYFMAGPGTCIAWGEPDFVSGGVLEGYTSYQDADLNLQVDRDDPSAGVIPVFKIHTSGHYQHQTSTGHPTREENNFGFLTSTSLTEGDHTLVVDTSLAAVPYDVNLPPVADYQNVVFQIKRFLASPGGAARRVRINPQVGEQIDNLGAGVSLDLTSAGQSVELKATGSQWHSF